MKKLFLTIIILLSFLQLSNAEPYVSTKLGYVNTNNDDENHGLLKEIAIGYDFDKFSPELSFGHYLTDVKGTEADSLSYKYVGELTVMPLLITSKYYVLENLYFGGGTGWAFMNFKENYSGKAKVKTSNIFNLCVGYEKNNWFIEVRRIFGDLKIESGNASIGVLEDHSRLESWQFIIGYKF